MKKLLFIILTLGFCIQSSDAQTLKQFRKKAIEAFNNKNYYAALSHYTTILEVDSTSNDVLYNHAEAARNYNAYSAAETSYEKISNSEVSNQFQLKDTWFTCVKKNLGKYDEAIELAKRDSRRLAKRQMTWFRNQTPDWPKLTNRTETQAFIASIPDHVT